MKSILLTQGHYASVDDEDYEWLNQWKWRYHKGYAIRRDSTGFYFMHVVIAERHGLVFSPVLDHKDRRGTNNQKENFRSASHTEQGANRDKQTNNTSGYIGVGWHKATNKWRATIKFEGKHRHIGSYSDKVEAAKAYDVEALRLFGVFAVLNFPVRKD